VSGNKTPFLAIPKGVLALLETPEEVAFWIWQWDKADTCGFVPQPLSRRYVMQGAKCTQRRTKEMLTGLEAIGALVLVAAGTKTDPAKYGFWSLREGADHYPTTSRTTSRTTSTPMDTGVVDEKRTTSRTTTPPPTEPKRSTQPNPTQPKDNKGERDGPNLSTDSDPLARFAAVLWRQHFTEIMGFPYKPTRSKWLKMLPHLREMAQIAGCDRESTVDTVEGHRLNGAIKHYITAAKGRAIWPHKTGDAAPCPRTMRQHHLEDCLAAAPAWRCPPCDGSGLRHGAYLVSTGDRVETKNFACEECRPEALAKQRAILAEMGRVEGETFWVRDVYPHEPLYLGFYNLVQETKAKVEAAKRGSK